MTRLTVTLCGSLTRAADDLARVAWHLAAAGHDVRAPKPAPADVTPTAEQVRNLVAGHLDDISRSVIVLGVVPDGLVGDRTGDEMAHAARVGAYTRWALSPAEVDELLADVAAGRLLDRPEVARYQPTAATPADIQDIAIPGLDTVK